MTLDAPAAIALQMSPEYFTPPSAIIGIALLPARGANGFKHGRQLWHADAGDYAGRADGAGPDPHLDGKSAPASISAIAPS